jgi:hypothetical protein
MFERRYFQVIEASTKCRFSSAVEQRFCNSARVIADSISTFNCVGFAGLPVLPLAYLIRPVVFRYVGFGANLRASSEAASAFS